ncbi:MAG TPA: NUDIX domain-containing protein [Burkholderiaceae bacterium]|nr:NUDIX domain-containing protein [Burkholderiaceae bacterium]
MPTIKKRSYGMVPVAIDSEGDRRFLILRAFRNWDFPKGAAERAETPLMAAAREMREETGISDFELPYGEICKDTEAYAGGKVATFFIAKVRQEKLTLPISEELGRPEHNEYRWATAQEARELLPVRLVAILDWVISIDKKAAA